MFSQTEENYLKVIFLLEYDFGQQISTNKIAAKLSTKASSVTDMLKKLAIKKLVIHQKYKGVLLTKKGKKIATTIIRKHRLWETFLVQKLNFDWDEVHDIAEQLEHIKSDKLILNLDSFLKFPKQDPHGDPIPDKNGKMRTKNTILLSDARVKKQYKIIGIKDSSSTFLKYLDNLRIKINTNLKVLQKTDYDNSILVIFNKNTITLSEKVCQNLYIK